MQVIDGFEHKGVKAFKFGYHPFSTPRMFVHVYWVDGLLIDTAQRNVRKPVLDQLHDLDVQQIYLTHYHEDHTGNVEMLKNHFKAPVYSSALCKHYMQSPPPISFVQRAIWGNRAPFTEIEVVENTLKTPKHTFNLIHTPGHCPDMHVLHEAERGWLFSADLYVNSYIGYFIDEESILDQIRSIEKVLTLDFDTMFCAHNPQLKDGKAQLRKKLQFLNDFYGQVTELYNEGYTAKGIFNKMSLKENYLVRVLSGGKLSKMNMVRSAIRDYKKE